MEEWRCVSSCSAGFYATKPNPEIADGHRICRRWALWCVFRCGWVVYLLMAGLIVVADFSMCVCVCAGYHACSCCCVPAWGCSFSPCLCVWVCLCSASVLSSSGVTPAVSPVRGRAGETAAAVPAGTACRRECVLLTLSAQTVSQPSFSSNRCWLTAARLIRCSSKGKVSLFSTSFGGLRAFFQ